MASGGHPIIEGAARIADVSGGHEGRFANDRAQRRNEEQVLGGHEEKNAVKMEHETASTHLDGPAAKNDPVVHAAVAPEPGGNIAVSEQDVSTGQTKDDPQIRPEAEGIHMLNAQAELGPTGDGESKLERGELNGAAAVASLEVRTKKVTLVENDYLTTGRRAEAREGAESETESKPSEAHSPSSYPTEKQLPASPTGSTGRGTSFRSTSKRNELSKSMQRSQFGKMVDSVKQSAPSIAFGVADRFSHGSIGYVPSGEGVPGPGCYESVESIGKDTGSSEHSHHPAFHFGNEERFKGAGTSGLSRIPDPGKYDIPPSIGRQTLSTKESASPKSFVKATRNVKVSIGKGFEEDMYGLDAPGPGTYVTKSGFGSQASSDKSTSPLYGFGTNARAVGGGRSLDERKASEMPGPGEYVSVSSVGPQVESSRPSKPAFPFGSAGRSGVAGKSAAAPGPGAYKNEKSGFGAQLVSPKRSMPAVSFTSASRFPRTASDKTPGPGSYCT